MFQPEHYWLARRIDKKPIDPGWARLSTQQYNDWRADRGDVALRCGGEMGIVVLDVDVDKETGEISPATMAELMAMELPDTLKVPSRRGWHYFFEYHGPALGTHIRFQSKGDLDFIAETLIFLWPDEKGNLAHYDTSKIAALPQSVIDRVAKAPAKAANGTAQLLPGNRNATLASMAGQLMKGGDDPQAAYNHLREVNAASPSPLPEQEVARVVASISRYHPPKPAPEPVTADRLGVDIQDVLAMSIPPIKQLIGPFSEGGVYIIAGPPGVAKSFWTGFMWLALAGEQQFCEWAIPVNRRVLLIDGEMNYRLQFPRWEMMARHRGVVVITEDQFQDGGTMPVLSEPRWQAHFESAAYNDFDVFVFDTTSSLFDAPGDMKATDLEYWQQVRGFNRRMRMRGKTLFYIDHTTGYDPNKVGGSYSKLQGIEACIILTDERQTADEAPIFDSHAIKNRIYFEGSPGFSHRWYWSTEFKRFFRTHIPPKEKKHKK